MAMAMSMASSSRKRMASSDIPNDCWELVVSKLLNDNEIDKVEERNHYLETLSMVSKQLLSISSTFVNTFKLISNPSSRLFHRFTNLTSLDLSTFHGGDINALLSRIPPASVSRLTSLNLSNHPTFPKLGLQSIILNNNNNNPTFRLTSLICSNIASLKFTDITFIAHSFPFLQHLDISFDGGGDDDCIKEDYNNALKLVARKLSNLLKVNLSGNVYVNDSSLLELCINCEFLQEVLILHCPLITHAGIAFAIRRRPSLNSLSISNFREDPTQIDDFTSYFIDSLATLKNLTCLDLSFSGISDVLLYSIALDHLPLRKLVLQGCYNYTYTGISYLLSKRPSLQHLDLRHAVFLDDQRFNHLCQFFGELVSINVGCCDKLTNSSFFALLTNCPMLAEIRMESTKIGIGPTPSVVDLVVYPQVKSLHLAYNSALADKHINIFGFMFPKLQLLDLSFCRHISQQHIAILLKRCNKIRHLEFACFPQAKPFSIDFDEASNLEVLNLSHSTIDDEELYEISKFFPRLLQLDLGHCYDVTDKGVGLAVENFTHLREINLRQCRKVSTNIVSSMIFSRPSLRKITAPPHFRPRDCDRKLLFRQCLVF
ncbi:F-box/LRR-repeat protein 3-like [Trifolium pratense]|uniref:F-box/LRR-repeat protein 3-like n=1 Tax=Trifolium pratense TaxID=57577 RepID=UPI001E693B24|nr:F-box/LRR-repeat protein 3-like [Trifolium pratense]XP_045788790.1 F-box/LRR-repeat protein 3-like [Trifolium pratense]XP_045788791.1 F-box/LRR-repeat protein 3-like [Trifolium pratense]XP_045788792.1 F-box/LRR-repeat protein 3-like [Trifolium pratense]XP_045788793.1 F-box/LRR-repeat protein 3-like [Trifolium pratense]XP_045788794.1 F-box/LRR-repeat protein 3-like [Trifolium pratense]XP_045788795.1 F-box/LRR-repeat protein 3-like [Trifolium pratense]XP_045788796.1 F-box/LRR-repeat protein